MWEESKLAKGACSGSLTPGFVNNDYLTAEIIYRTAHVRHKGLTWSPGALCCEAMWSPPEKWQLCYCIWAVSVGSATGGDYIACPPYGCCPGEERTHLFSAPTSPQALLQPPRLCIVYTGLSEQWAQSDTRQLASGTGSAIHKPMSVKWCLCFSIYCLGWS